MAAAALRQSLLLVLSSNVFCQDLFVASNHEAVPPRKLQGDTCQLSAKCVQGLNAQRKCYTIKRNGGKACYKGLRVWQKDLTATYGCPAMTDPNEPIMNSRAFCWCGIFGVPQVPNVTEQMLEAPVLAVKEPVHRGSEQVNSFMRGALAMFDRSKHHVLQGNVSTAIEDVLENVDGALVGKHKCHGACCGKDDGKKEKHYGKNGMSNFMKQCATEETDKQSPPSQGSTAEYNDFVNCMHAKSGVGNGCASCYGHSIQCSEQYCLAECACVSWQDKTCNDCMTAHCKGSFDKCSGLS